MAQKSINPFEKIDTIKQLAEIIIPQISQEDLKQSIESVYRVHIKEKSPEKLSKRDIIIKKVLNKAKINPTTARWYFQAYNLPTNLKMRLRTESISYSEARRINSNLRLKGDNPIKEEIMRDLRKYVKDLKINEFIDRTRDMLRRGYWCLLKNILL